MLEIDILRNSSHKKLRCLEGWFFRAWVSKKTPTPLLAKTMSQVVVDLHAGVTVYENMSVYNIFFFFTAYTITPIYFNQLEIYNYKDHLQCSHTL